MGMTRHDVAEEADDAGHLLNQLRNNLLEINAPFVAGIVRGAEEAILLAFNTLKDEKIPVDEL